MPMKGKFLLISGSAGYPCPQAKMEAAIKFIRCLTREVLGKGGTLVVLGSDEDATRDESGTPRIFDWVVLREVAEYAKTTTEAPRAYALVVMSDEAVEGEIDDSNLRLLTNLEQRNIVELCHIRRERFTGGEYRKAQIDRADAMLGIGGGKGTYSAGTEMTASGKPVLPLDLRLDSLGGGEGALALHREMMSDPSRFFPNTHRDVINRIGLISLNRGINDAGSVAQVAVEVIEKELNAVPQTTWRARAKGRLVSAWQVAKALPVVSAAIKIIESMLRAVG